MCIRDSAKLIIVAILGIVILSFTTGSKFDSNNGSNLVDTIKVIEPSNQYKVENQLITSILSRYHFKDFVINDSLSEIIFNRYLEALDNGKNYFLKSDIESFLHFKKSLDENLYDGNVQFYLSLIHI